MNNETKFNKTVFIYSNKKNQYLFIYLFIYLFLLYLIYLIYFNLSTFMQSWQKVGRMVWLRISLNVNRPKFIFIILNNMKKIHEFEGFH
jgi:hypothetical protein